MDETTFNSLRAALGATPDNQELRAVLLRAALDRDDAAGGADLLNGVDPASMEETEHREIAGRVLLKAGDAEGALAFTEGDDPKLLILRARVLLALERRDEGLKCYQDAVGRRPALEDLDLRSALNANVRSFPNRTKDGKPALRVISNDDTDDSEMRRLLIPDEGPVSFADVGGLDDIKKQIRKRIILPFQKPSLFQRFKKRVGGGILLYGPPGCGKTLLARATAGECDASFFNVAIADILDMWIGESERKLHAIFEKARESTPAVLFFDEIEGLGGKRQYTRDSTSSKLVSQFLSEMDGFTQNNDGVLILGATNVPWAIDPAFRRPGRFDRLLFVPPPDAVARKRILELMLEQRPSDERIDLEIFTKDTGGFSGADLANLVESAVDVAIEESIEQGEDMPIRADHLREALQEVRPTTSEWLTTARNYARYANESGHYDDVLHFIERYTKKKR